MCGAVEHIGLVSSVSKSCSFAVQVYINVCSGDSIDIHFCAKKLNGAFFRCRGKLVIFMVKVGLRPP